MVLLDHCGRRGFYLVLAHANYASFFYWHPRRLRALWVSGDPMNYDHEPILRQAKILRWSVETFGSCAGDPQERARRFLEEALEVAQAADVPRETVEALMSRVFTRNRGDVRLEIVQAGLALEALAEVHQVYLDFRIDKEFERVQNLPRAHWRARQDKKSIDGLGACCD